MNNKQESLPFLTMGFRPFFLGAGLFAVVSMTLWSAIYLFQQHITMESISVYQWHAHEMIYGYAVAVIAGFLLTSVHTWTRLPTAHGRFLLALFVMWAAARLLLLFGTRYIQLAGLFDITFSICLTFLLTLRIIQAKQWPQFAIAGKVMLITLFNLSFYLGAAGLIEHGVMWGIYGGLYIVLTLILTMGRRVIPFFIERAAGGTVHLRNARWLDISSMVLLLGFAINEVFVGRQDVSAYLALCLFLVHAIRLVGWHHPVIWKQSLLWSVYLSVWMITFGFLLVALRYFAPSHFATGSSFLAIHAFTVGGIAVITLGMMSRVALGHTGNDVYHPPRTVAFALLAILACAVVRTILPQFMLWPYEDLIGISQALWITAFLLFIATYAPLLTKAKRG